MREVSKRWAWAAAIAVMAGVVLAYLQRPLPERLQRLLAGSSSAERWGGLRVTVRDSDEASPRTLELAGLDEPAAKIALEILGQPLTFRAVYEGESSPFDDDALIGSIEAFSQLGLDQWSDANNVHHRVPVVESRERASLERTFAMAASQGWNASGAFFVGYEDSPSPDDRERAPLWRAFALGEALMDRKAIAGAQVVTNQYSYAPNVQMTLTAEGASRFCELSGKLSGHKLAIASGHRVWSAPILNGPICGGKLTTGVGEDDPRSDAAALAAVLALPELPPGAVVVEHQLFPLRPLGGRVWLGRILLGALAGLGAGLGMGLVLSQGRPSWRASRPREAEAGPLPWRRLAFTAAAPLTALALIYVPLPGVLAADDGGPMIGMSLGALGLTPLLGSFVLVELVAVAVPAWRHRRTESRRPAGFAIATVALAMLLSALQGYVLARYFESVGVADPGWQFRISTMLSAAAATALLAWIAGVADARGLGNGYGALLAGFLLTELCTSGRLSQLTAAALPDGLALAGIAGLTGIVLHWQIAGGQDRAPLQAPAAGDSPLSSLPGLITGLALFASIGLLESAGPLAGWLAERAHQPLWVFGFAVLSTPLWAWLWARPSLLAARARRASLAATSMADWRRAVIVSTGYSAAMALLWSALSTPPLLLAGAAMSYLTAVALDLFADARAYRRSWRAEPLVVLHDVQQAALVEEALRIAGIACHLRGRNLRTLLAFFGPFAPIAVLVPEDKADAAYALILARRS